MVTTADTEVGLQGFSYSDLSDCRGAVRDLKKTIEGRDVTGASPPPGPQPNDEPSGSAKTSSTLLAEEQSWTNAEGNTITAAVLMADEKTVTFLLPNGKSVGYPIAKLSAASQEEVRALLK
ncbi:hypothetical protein [Roseibacillus ishigakijimensis]|nr:hypothetical protein [Roseibacillus ishigakijimensis]